MLKNAFNQKKKKKQETGGEKWTSGGDDDDAVDSEHVNELSDLFSTIESEFADGSAIDFSVLLEGEHAFNVEEVSEIFTDLEGAAATPAVTTQDVDDAAVVDEVAALFASLEELRKEEECTEAEVDTDSDNESTEGAAVGAADVKDAENVDELSDLFSVLEEKESESAVATPNHADWIASLDVDDVSALYSELETLQQPQPQPQPQPTSMPAAKEERRAVDPRIFVPKFSVRMDGAAAAPAVPLHRVGATTGAFLAGPPGLLLAGPPVRHTSRGLGVAPPPPQHEKRKAAADPIISATRRICAAKRRRVNGRFVREQNSFVSITSLQPTPYNGQ